MAEFQITLAPNGGSFSCAEGQTVLDAAIAAGYWLPHSCREGTCDACCLPVLDGALEDGAVPSPAGQCRTCQARPASDLQLDAPTVPAEPGQRVVTVGARVQSVERVSHDVAVVTLQVPPASGFRFQAGQYLDVLLRDGSRRSYSMANAPDETGLVEWHVRRMEGGRFSPHAYDKLKARDLLRVSGPFGTFLLQDTEAPVILLASGTGFAPIAALLRTHGAALARRGAVLYWGGRRLADLYAYGGEAAWAEQYPGVRCVPVLSEPEGEWAGRTGFVHQAVLQDWPDLAAHEVYACGNPLMIDAARSSFTTQAGLPATQFFCDAFVTQADAAAAAAEVAG